MAEIKSRQCIVSSAQGWFDESRKAQNDGRMREAILYMENAFNHTENALAAVLDKADLPDQPPLSGVPKSRLDGMRDKLANLTPHSNGDRGDA